MDREFAERFQPADSGPAGRSRRGLVSAAVAGVALVAIATAAWALLGILVEPPPSLEEQLDAALAKAVPTLNAKARQDVVAGFVKAPSHRAVAAARLVGGTWHTGDWPSVDIAAEKALEKCQQFHEEICAVVAVNGQIVPPDERGLWEVNDATRVLYAGGFDIERIPAMRPKDLQRADIMSYAAASGAKAMAFHANGVLHVVTSAPSQQAAEEQALRACNSDPGRGEAGGPCYLYAVGDNVVLPRRWKAARNPSASVAAVPTARQEDERRLPILLDVIGKVVPEQSAATRQSLVAAYRDMTTHKALAVFPPFSSWRSDAWNSEASAEEGVLEGCQARYGGPCVLVAVNDNMQPDLLAGNPRKRPMPRATYEGMFDPRQIPAIPDAARQRPDVVGYKARPAPKAAAFHPSGRVYFSFGARTLRAAEEAALAQCNTDPKRGSQGGTCLLYASDDQVVLPKGLSVPMTPPGN